MDIKTKFHLLPYFLDERGFFRQQVLDKIPVFIPVLPDVANIPLIVVFALYLFRKVG